MGLDAVASTENKLLRLEWLRQPRRVKQGQEQHEQQFSRSRNKINIDVHSAYFNIIQLDGMELSCQRVGTLLLH